MADNLVIVESPSKAKTIGKFLGKKYKVVASAGHVRDLPKSKIGVDIANNFEPSFINIRGKSELIKSLKKDAKNAKKIILATDPDREGEAISWHIAHLFDLDPKSECRVTFNEITKDAVTDAITKPRAIDEKLVDTYQARRVLDRIVGYEVSPVIWKKIKPKLSGGRVQSAVLKMICDREDEIEAFEPEEYWSISALLSKEGAKEKAFTARFFGINGKKAALGCKEDAQKVLDETKNNDFVVDELKTADKRVQPFPPFTTSTLQQAASRKLGFTAYRTMNVAQQLYEGVDLGKNGMTGLITYMRTDSMRIADEAAAAASDVIKKEYGDSFLPPKRRFYRNKSNAQDAHEAIRPAHINFSPADVKDRLTSEQYKLYKLIYERFIASQMADEIVATGLMTVNCGKYTFKATGSSVKFAGFTKVYDDTFDGEEDNKNLPSVQKGEVLKLGELKPEQHFTAPPSRYTEAMLVKAMEDNGIGRPSTYAPTISVLQTRKYVGKEKKTLYPTEIGRLVNDLMKGSFPDIVNLEFTAHIEEEFDKIAQGEIKWQNVIGEFYTGFSEEVKKAVKEVEHYVIPVRESDVMCPNCNIPLVYRTGKGNTEFLGCRNYPKCRETRSIIQFANVDCPECKKPLAVRKAKTGRKYYACTGYPDCKFTSLYLPVGRNCPECGKYLEKVGFGAKAAVRCSNKECGYKESRKNSGEK